MRKNIILLGSTGSIGCNTLDIVKKFPDQFQAVGLTGGSNGDKLKEQIEVFKPRVVALLDHGAAHRLQGECRHLPVEILSGIEGLKAVATLSEGHIVVSAIVGAAGLVPTLSAIRSKKEIALANKETMVMAGELVNKEVREHQTRLLPVDSEHSAIFQSLEGHRKEDLSKLILTASGGPLWDLPKAAQENVTPEEALNHPNWKMGAKISIDSATMMNKGLEMIEARWLFDVIAEKIEILIHRQSVIHSMVEFIDGSVIAQLGIPDMRGPIAYALNYPKRLPLKLPSLDLSKIGNLTFFKPDLERFPCISLAYEAMDSGGTFPTVLNASNEEAVGAFLERKIPFSKISAVIQQTLGAHNPKSGTNLDDILMADQWAREEARRTVKSHICH
ncbi:MAG TPA: 1-deoxy-D-xylulose-5-phosphate reductoisomerase [Nitrospiria bacterium]|jgi:1-deoxy-D-xylulose-5-phosphate reductoisomerase